MAKKKLVGDVLHVVNLLFVPPFVPQLRFTRVICIRTSSSTNSTNADEREVGVLGLLSGPAAWRVEIDAQSSSC